MSAMMQLRLEEASLDTYAAMRTGTDRQRLEEKYAPLLREELSLGKVVSYVGNKKVPILRLYRYKEAFAYPFVDTFISRFELDQNDFILDPFCGMGTTLFTASLRGIPSIGVDKLPVPVFVARTLPLFYHSLQPGQIAATFEAIKPKVQDAPPADVALDVAIMGVGIPPDTLLALRKWKRVIDDLSMPMRDVFLLLFFAILEPCSYTAKDGQVLTLAPRQDCG